MKCREPRERREPLAHVCMYALNYQFKYAKHDNITAITRKSFLSPYHIRRAIQ